MRLFPLVLLLTAATGSADPPPPQQEPPSEPKNYTATAGVQPNTVPVGQPARLTLTITPQSPWVLKNETPFTAVVTAPQGVSVAKDKLGSKDFQDPKAPAKSVGTELTASAAGTYTVNAELTFFVCSSDLCKRQREHLTVQLTAH